MKKIMEVVKAYSAIILLIGAIYGGARWLVDISNDIGASRGEVRDLSQSNEAFKDTLSVLLPMIEDLSDNVTLLKGDIAILSRDVSKIRSEIIEWKVSDPKISKEELMRWLSEWQQPEDTVKILQIGVRKK